MTQLWLHGELELDTSASQKDTYATLCHIAEQCGFAIHKLDDRHVLTQTDERSFLLCYDEDGLLNVHRATYITAMPDNLRLLKTFRYQMSLHQLPSGQLWLIDRYVVNETRQAYLVTTWTRHGT